jgi:hypothetical protein
MVMGYYIIPPLTYGKVKMIVGKRLDKVYSMREDKKGKVV